MINQCNNNKWEYIDCRNSVLLIVLCPRLSGESPFQGNSDAETFALVTAARYEFDPESFEDILDQAKDFIRSLLKKDRRWGKRGARWLCLDLSNLLVIHVESRTTREVEIYSLQLMMSHQEQYIHYDICSQSACQIVLPCLEKPFLKRSSEKAGSIWWPLLLAFQMPVVMCRGPRPPVDGLFYPSDPPIHQVPQ